MDYIGIVTNAGRAKIAAALASGTNIEITSMAYGDGNGASYTPIPSQTALVHQIGVLTSLVKEEDDNWAYFSSTIPANVQTFTLRELGLYDNSGTLIAIANTPEVTKPLSTSGSAVSLPVTMGVSISNGQVLIVEIAEGQDYPTKTWVLNALHSITEIDGGTF